MKGTICKIFYHNYEITIFFVDLFNTFINNMKKFCLFILIFSFTVAYSNNDKSILNHLNKNWISVPISSSQIPELNLFSEIDLIKFHLDYVVDSLKRVNTSHLQPQAKSNREQLLNELSKYSKEGVFPQNLYHKERTPYFIDDFGTACAVGHLIIQSGQRDLAESIADTENYSYIEDMPQLELINWATEFGFTVDELKWIQPGYGPRCLPGQVIQPTCANNPFSNTGCFNPDWQLAGLTAPVVYLTEYNNGSGWLVDSLNSWQIWGAIPGQYRITVTGALNLSIVYNYTITAPPAIIINDSIIQHSTTAASCDGIIKISPVFGTPPYQIQLINTNLPSSLRDSNGVFDSLCPATYTVIVNDINNCQSTGSIQVFFSTALTENENSDDIVFKNPLTENRLNLRTSLKGEKTFRLINIQGKVILQSTFYNPEYNCIIDAKNGVYILEVSNANKRLQKKFVISK